MIEEPTRLQGDEKAVLLCEETMVTRRIVVRERERIELSTMDFLKLLEAEQRIQSADAVFDRALAAGRTPSRVEKFSEHDRALRDAVRDTLGTARRVLPRGARRRRKS